MLRLRLFCAAFTFAGAFLSAHSQAPETAPPPQSSTFTLDVGTRLVIEDVSVTDRKGDPVTGLPRSAFHIRDNRESQAIRDFAETARGAVMDAAARAPGEYSNRAIYRATGTSTALLVDPTDMALPDQMYLRLQMLKYLRSLQAGTPVAIFRANSRGIPVLIQSLTSDRSLLEAAVNNSVPAIARPADSFSNAIAELQNVSDYLRAVPGKKLLLWFAGRFPLYLDPDLCSVAGPAVPTIDSNLTYSDCGSLNDVRKGAFRALEQARVAVYPIDVRGVVVLGAPAIASPNTALLNQPGSFHAPPNDPSLKISGQYDEMDQLASATGGRAYYSNNALAEAMNSAVTTGEHSYTLTYRPEPYKTDGHWHKVSIAVDGPYTVRYRAGYYAGEAAPPPRPLLTAGGVVPAANVAERLHTTENAADAPIVFRAHVGASDRTKKDAHIEIMYSISPDQLAFTLGPDAAQHAQFRLAVLAYNGDGDVLNKAMDTVETHFSTVQMATAQRIGTPALQSLQVAKGAKFLLLAVEDLRTHRVGTLQLTLKDVEAGAQASR